MYNEIKSFVPIVAIIVNALCETLTLINLELARVLP